MTRASTRDSLTGLSHPAVWARILDRPHLATPAVLQSVLRVMAERSGRDLVISGLPDLAAQHLDAPAVTAWFDDDDEGAATANQRPYQVHDGMAIIPVRGTLVMRNGLHPECGMTGYEGLSTKIELARLDPAVHALVLDVDSGGGEAAGCFEVADQLWDFRQEKPLWASCTPEAYSAAYALVSQAERVFVPIVGGTGSVGVISVHVDQSARLAQDGMAVTIIQAGARKSDGHPYAPLPDAVRDRWQAITDEIRSEFVARVARGRGISEAVILATEADCLTPTESLRLGFATDQGDLDACLSALSDHLSSSKDAAPMTKQAPAASRPRGSVPRAGKSHASRPSRRAEVPAEDEEDPDAPAAEGDMPDDEDDPDAPEGDEDPAAEDGTEDEEDDKPATPAARKAAKASAAKERKRWASVMSDPRAQANPKLASALLSGSSMSASAVLTALDAVGTPAQASGPTGFQAAMRQHSHPGVRAEGGKEKPQSGLSAAVAAEAARITGRRSV